MEASIKVKDRKKRKKCERKEIEEGIPEKPLISDFEPFIDFAKVENEEQESRDCEKADTKYSTNELSPCETKDASNSSSAKDVCDSSPVESRMQSCESEPSAPLAQQVVLEADNSILTVFQSIETPLLINDNFYDHGICFDYENDVILPLEEEEEEEQQLICINQELNQSEEFVHEFLERELEVKNQHPFFELLTKYLHSRINLKKDERKINECEKELDSDVKKIWTVWKDVEISEVEKCKDGISLSFVHKYCQARFNEHALQKLKTTLSEIKKILYESQNLNSFFSLVLKLKIEYYLHGVMTSCPEFSNLSQNSSPLLASSGSNSYFQQCLYNLETSISILFHFQRKCKSEVEETFLKETRGWLSNLVAVVIRVGSWRDHLFLLNHVIRCPGGVSTWASHFVQLPQKLQNSSDPFSSLELNHMMAVMSLLLKPISKRRDFLKEYCSVDDDNPWVFVDSEDEEDDDDEENHLSKLKENDLVLLLNQIPFTHLFGKIIKLNNITEQHLFHLFSFSTSFIKIVHGGLLLYSTKRYRQFTKRLGRLIHHVLQYVTDEYTLYKSLNPDDKCCKLQTKYDRFFLKSTKYIYSSRKYGAWQFLAVVPFNVASSKAIWTLYGILQSTIEASSNKLKGDLLDFEEKFAQLTEGEQFYLLSTFTNMALARDLTELNFIKLVVFQLFHVGFLSEFTKDVCFKNVKSLLHQLCSVHPFLMSDILSTQQRHFIRNPNDDQQSTIYLWMDLPCDLWIPNEKDLDVIAVWLTTQPLQSIRCELAKIILGSLNYGTTDGGDLFLKWSIHRDVAWIVTKANVKFIPETETNVMMKNVSNLVRNQPKPEHSFQQWSWNLLLRLRLHLLDQSEISVRKSFLDLSSSLKEIAEFEKLNELTQLVDKKHPMACFVAIMTTTLGHSVPIIFNQGFSVAENLIICGKYEAAVACIDFMSLMFIECSDSLQKCEKFISVLSQLITADYSYLNLAKNLMSSAANFPGPILTILENMMTSQVNSSRISFGFSSPSPIIELWLSSLTKIPMWTQDSGVLYLVDKLLQHTFFDCSSARSITILRDLIQDGSRSPTGSETRSSFSFTSWISSPSAAAPGLLLKEYDGETPWLSYRVIETEHDLYEMRNSLWPELLRELSASASVDKKTNIDGSLKKVCSSLKIPTRSSNRLAIYRWVNQILETNINHPLLILLWQKFFTLYLQRVPDLVDRGSVGQKFFEGLTNGALFKRLKQRLKETEQFYLESSSSSTCEYFSECHRLMSTFALWLDEPKLFSVDFNVHFLSDEFRPELLNLLIHGNSIPWLQFLDLGQIQQECSKSSSCWLKLRNRSDENKKRCVKRTVVVKEKSPAERISERLSSYESPSSPPPLIFISTTQLPSLTENVLLHSDAMISYLSPSLKIIVDHASKCALDVSQHTALGCDVHDLLPQLYQTKENRIALKQYCQGIIKTPANGVKVHCKCAGPAIVEFKLQESKMDGRIEKSLDNCIKDLKLSIQRGMHPLPTALSVAAFLLDNAIETLSREYQTSISLLHHHDEERTNKLRDSGTCLFYHLIKIWSKEEFFVPCVEKSFENYLDRLGSTFVVGNPIACHSFLEIILKSPKLSNRLITWFTPNAASTSSFIEMYSMVVDRSISETTFAILSKFDLSKWLLERKPKVFERSHLIAVIGRGLKMNASASTSTVEEMLDFHLKILLLHDFPEHYGEILQFLLEGSDCHAISTRTWFTFLNALSPSGATLVEGENKDGLFEPGQSGKKLKFYFSKYATDQNLLTLDDIYGTVTLLGSRFKIDRLKHGLYGLYPKFRPYAEPLFIFFGMLSHSCVAKALQVDVGSLSDKIMEKLWPLIAELFSPWLIPYGMKNEKTEAASWIRELSDDRCILLPWTTNDSRYASFCLDVFVESVRFVLDTLPGVNNILNYVWQFYVANFAHSHVKDHILIAVHKSLSALPWNAFFPSVIDVELMLKVADQFLPLCHSFLGNVFVEIRWTNLVHYYSSCFDQEANAKLHVCLMNLLVKLPSEPSLKQNKQIFALLKEANGYAWHLIDSYSYDSVLNWFVMSCDPRIVLMDEKSEYYHLDSNIMMLLQNCAGYVATAKLFHPTTLTKRLAFIRANVKWLVTCSSRYKCKQSSLFKSAICTILSDVENILNATVPVQQKVDEAALLLAEFLVIFKETELISVVEESISHWLATRSAGIVVLGFLKSAGTSLQDAGIYGRIVENCLTSYFDSPGNNGWSEVVSILAPFSLPHLTLEKLFISNNQLLTLYAAFSRRLANGSDEKTILNESIHILSTIKPCESTEPKLTVFVIRSLTLIDNQSTDCHPYLIKISEILNEFMNFKESGILSSLGLRKSGSPSTRFKLFCLVAKCGIIVLVKKCEKENGMDEKALQTLDQLNSNKQYQNLSFNAASVTSVTTLKDLIDFLHHFSIKLFNKSYLK